METKLFEIRDSGTLIPALAIRVSGEDGYLMRRAGFGGACVYLIHLEGERCSYDPYHWEGGSRTMPMAHEYIESHWDKLKNGQVIDIQFIGGETPKPKLSEEVTTKDWSTT